jgi:hypothetical protein
MGAEPRASDDRQNPVLAIGPVYRRGLQGGLERCCPSDLIVWCRHCSDQIQPDPAEQEIVLTHR